MVVERNLSTARGELHYGCTAWSSDYYTFGAGNFDAISSDSCCVTWQLMFCSTCQSHVVHDRKSSMPLYDYRCPSGDVVEKFFPMNEKPDSIDCPQCGQVATSVLPAIGPSKLNSPQMRALDATQATAESPNVVRSVTGTRTAGHQATQYSTNPLHQKLPRP